jgi:hypothetical protein
VDGVAGGKPASLVEAQDDKIAKGEDPTTLAIILPVVSSKIPRAIRTQNKHEVRRMRKRNARIRRRIGMSR